MTIETAVEYTSDAGELVQLIAERLGNRIQAIALSLKNARPCGSD